MLKAGRIVSKLSVLLVPFLERLQDALEFFLDGEYSVLKFKPGHNLHLKIATLFKTVL